ncbi:hypothetical protein D3C81_1696090 [compost metagenome]
MPASTTPAISTALNSGEHSVTSGFGCSGEELKPLYPEAFLTIPRTNRNLEARTSLTTEDAAPGAWDQFYGRPSRQAQTDYLSQGLGVPGTHQLKGPAIVTVQSASGHTQRVGLVSGTHQYQLNDNGAQITPAMSNPGRDTLHLQGQSLGAYWSLTGPQGWHVDLTCGPTCGTPSTPATP